MKKQAMRIATFGVLSAITFVNINSVSFASGNVSSVLPQAGISYALGSNQVSLSNLQQSLEEDTKDSKAETSVSTGTVRQADTEVSIYTHNES